MPRLNKFPNAKLFDANSRCNGTENEYKELIAGFIRAIKPEVAMETGVSQATSTMVIGRALRRNGFGKLISIEARGEIAKAARVKLQTEGVPVEIKIGKSLAVIAQHPADQKIGFAYFDTTTEMQWREFELCLERHLFEEWAIATFHDSARTINRPSLRDRHARAMREEIDRLCDLYRLPRRINMPYSRGLTIVQIPGGPEL